MLLFTIMLAAAQPASGAAPVSSDPPRPAAAPAAAVAKETKASSRDKLVCRTSMATGHHIADRVCRTQYDWDRMEADGKAYADRLLRQQNACGGAFGC